MNQPIDKQSEYIIRAFPDITRRRKIDRQTFTKLETKAKILDILWYMEDHYALIGQAYKNFEMSLFEVAFDVRHLSKRDTGEVIWPGRQKIRISLIALLNAIQTYFGNLRKYYIKDLKELTQEDWSGMKNQLLHSHTTRLERRIMRTLRNCITHDPYTDIPGSIHCKPETPGTENSPQRHRITNDPTIAIDILARNQEFKREFGDEIKIMRQGECNSFDVKFMLRGYIEEVAKIHGMFREKTESLFNDILNTLRETEMNMFSDAEIPPIIQLVEFNAKNNDKELYHIGHKQHFLLKDRRQEWQNLSSEQKYYYSSEIISRSNKYPQEDPEVWIAR